MTFDPEEQPTQGPVIRDKRRIDPVTGQLRERPEPAAPAPAAEVPEPTPAKAEAELAERTADLQRLQAEYLNYKRRVDRERENTRTTAVVSTLAALLPVLDDIARAREHDELTGGFKAVADSLERTVTQLGMSSFGATGDPFDPRIHEALMHSYSEEVDEAVCIAILQVGYRIGERVVRPARVAVAEPPVPAAETSGAEAAQPVPAEVADPSTDDVDSGVPEGAASPEDERPETASYDENVESEAEAGGSSGERA